MIDGLSYIGLLTMCRERQTDEKQVDGTIVHEQSAQLLEQLHNQLNELLATTAQLQAESERLENEARQLIRENMQIQIEARLLKEKSQHRKRSTNLRRGKRANFQQLKQQLKHQRNRFSRFERRLRAKYERSLHRILSNTSPKSPQSYRRIQSMPSESTD